MCDLQVDNIRLLMANGYQLKANSFKTAKS